MVHRSLSITMARFFLGKLWGKAVSELLTYCQLWNTVDREIFLKPRVSEFELVNFSNSESVNTKYRLMWYFHSKNTLVRFSYCSSNFREINVRVCLPNHQNKTVGKTSRSTVF
jgi:hypothetical protein